MSNTLEAIVNAVDSVNKILEVNKNASNMMNARGDGLEEYVKSIFANTGPEMSENERRIAEQKVFSYFGNKSNPPDLMLVGHGDAIEVKKIESKTTEIQLNSSYPKDKLYVDNPKIKAACRGAENGWAFRDMLYIIGATNANSIRSLWFVYGDCFCADREVYKSVEKSIENAVKNDENIELSETNELAKIKKADPLGIATLRVRGMWLIANPMSYFKTLHAVGNNCMFEITAIMKEEKFNSFPKESIDRLINSNAVVKKISIKNPNNPILDTPAVLITFERHL